ncbi:MAG: thiamine phosphate synthase [Nitrospirae bacterium]|nr:thiamine phosphate synthase [Nitrospirota bacterium]
MTARRSFKKDRPLYLITDTAIAGLSHIQIVRLAIEAGITTIQLREEYLPKKDIYKAAISIREITKKYKVTFIVNDYLDIALAVNADGVHLGQQDMPVEEARRIVGNKKLIGISTHNLDQAIKAQESGADYIGFGPIFYTTTKNTGHPKGIEVLRKIRDHIDIPIVAIGGITWENVKEVLNAGAEAAAAVSGILTGDIQTNVRKFMEALT